MPLLGLGANLHATLGTEQAYDLVSKNKVRCGLVRDPGTSPLCSGCLSKYPSGDQLPSA